MYLVLYRKFRSPVFGDIVGQAHVTDTLRRSLAAGRLSHAYLFTGPRGTGKTSCARILAKAVNCESPNDGEPCNSCELCRGIETGAVLDVIEIDAASNNGVENIRALRDETNFRPAKGKYRVYIIDEVHMLSPGAFNALLKTLEEPPDYVLFILATTEVHKLPATVLSRCQRFDFKRISAEDICARLLYVAEKENFTLEEPAAMLLSRVADGGMRDALSLLDRCRGALQEGEAVTAPYVAKCIGLADRHYLFELLDALLEKDVAACLSIIGRLYNDSCDMERLCEELLRHLRNLLVLLTVGNAPGFIICTEEDMSLYQQQAALCEKQQLLRLMDTFAEAAAALRRSTDRRQTMEFYTIKLCAQREAPVQQSPVQQAPIQQPPVIQTQSPSPPTQPQPPSPPIQQPLPAAEPAAPGGEAGKKPEDRLFAEWPEIIDKLREHNPALAGVLDGSSAVLRGEYVLINSQNPAFPAFIKQGVHAGSLKEMIYHITDRKVRLGILKTDPPPAADPLVMLSKNYDNEVS